MTALRGVGVLVTRPEQQAIALCRLLEAEGAVTYRLPAIEVEPVPERRDLAAALGDPTRFAAIVFVSANAVRFGAFLLDAWRHGPAHELPLAAIGPATARALDAAGQRVTLVPAAGFDSEALLADPRLDSVRGRSVLIVKGRGGRELLQTAFAARGAEVCVAEVYERHPASPDPARLQALEGDCRAGSIDVITATSAEIGAALLHLGPPSLRECFGRAHWLVPSARVGEELARLGLRSPLIRATSAEDHDLVAALLRWRSSASGA
jgi:uroporphyrinogen-III synthase